MTHKLSIIMIFFGLVVFTNTASAIADSCKTVIDSTAFVTFKSTVSNQDFDDSKITIISNSLKTKCFSSEQIKSLLSLFSFEEDKITIAKQAYSKVIDPTNFEVIYSVFEFDSSKKEIRQHIDGLLKSN